MGCGEGGIFPLKGAWMPLDEEVRGPQTWLALWFHQDLLRAVVGQSYPAGHSGGLHPAGRGCRQGRCWCMGSIQVLVRAVEGKPQIPTLAWARWEPAPGPPPKMWQPWLAHVCWDCFPAKKAGKSWPTEHAHRTSGKDTS